MKKLAVVERIFWPLGTRFSGRCRVESMPCRVDVWNVRRDKKSGRCSFRGGHWGEVAVSGGSTVFTVLGLSPMETRVPHSKVILSPFMTNQFNYLLPVGSRARIPYMPEFFSGFLFATAKDAYITLYDLHSYNSSLRSSQVWFSYIHNFIIILSRVYNEPIQLPAPSWLVSLIGRALHRYRRSQGFESRTSLNSFQAFFSQLQKLRM